MLWGNYLRMGFARERGYLEITSSRQESPVHQTCMRLSCWAVLGQRECEWSITTSDGFPCWNTPAEGKGQVLGRDSEQEGKSFVKLRCSITSKCCTGRVFVSSRGSHNSMMVCQCRVLWAFCLQTEKKPRIRDLCLSPDCALWQWGSLQKSMGTGGLGWILAGLLTLMWCFGDKAGPGHKLQGTLGLFWGDTESSPQLSKCRCFGGCRGALCLQFTHFTTFPRAGLGSSPEWEEDCGGYSFLPWCLFLMGRFSMHTFSIPVYLGKVANDLNQFHPVPSSARLQSCSHHQVMLGVGGWGRRRQPRWAVVMLSLRVGEVQDLGTASALPNSRFTAHKMQSRQVRKGWLQKGSVKAQKLHQNKQCVCKGRIIDSWSHLGWKRPPKSWSLTFVTALPSPHQSMSPSATSTLVFKLFQGLWLHPSSSWAWQPFPLKKFNLIFNLTLLRASCPKDTSVVNQRCIIFTVCSKYLLAQSQVAKHTIPTVSQNSLLPVTLSARGLLN